MLKQAFPTKDEYFHELCETPVMSWPALVFFLAGVSILFFASYAALNGLIAYGWAALFNGFALYLFFSIMHDALHGNVAENSRLNEFFGRISLVWMIPFAPFEIARWIHNLHHSHAAGAKDPDNFMHHGKWWVLPFRWANFDLYYTAFFVQRLWGGDKMAKRYAVSVVIYVAILIGVVATLIEFDLGYELLMLWFIPSRIGLGLTGFVFVFLPHHPADISQHENKYAASTIRKGWEWILTPLMAYHNYHLIHHLYPTVPFYRYLKVWLLKYDELIEKKPAMQTPLGLRPVNR